MKTKTDRRKLIGIKAVLEEIGNTVKWLAVQFSKGPLTISK